MRKINKITSCFLLMIIIFTTIFSNVHAETLKNISYKEYEFSQTEHNIPETEIYRNDNYTLTYEYNNTENKTILKGYLNNNLVDICYFFDNDKEHIYSKTFRDTNSLLSLNIGNTDLVTEKIIKTSDIISIDGRNQSEDFSRLSSRGYLGKLKISLPYVGEWIFNISEDLSSVRYERYRVNNYIGSLINLAAAIIGAMNLPTSFTATFASGMLSRIIIGAGINIVSGQITDRFSTTLEAEVQDIIINARSDMFGSKRIISGKKAYITARSSKYYRETFYDGIYSRHWRTHEFAHMIIRHHFGYNHVNDYSYKYL